MKKILRSAALWGALTLAALTSGCSSGASPDPPEPDAVILTVQEDFEIPYRLYQHYYQASALQMAENGRKKWDEDGLAELREQTERMLMDDCVYHLLSRQLDISLSEEERASLPQDGTALGETQAFHQEAQLLREKIYHTLYAPDFRQAAVRVQCLFLPYGENASEEDRKSKRQLASLITSLSKENGDFPELCETLIQEQGAHLEEHYLTSGDMGQGVYELASDLAEGEVSQAFTLGSDGVWVMQRLPTDNAYVEEHLEELLDGATLFRQLYDLLVQVTRDYSEIVYSEEASRLPAPDLGGVSS